MSRGQPLEAQTWSRQNARAQFSSFRGFSVNRKVLCCQVVSGRPGRGRWLSLLRATVCVLASAPPHLANQAFSCLCPSAQAKCKPPPSVRVTSTRQGQMPQFPQVSTSCHMVP